MPLWSLLSGMRIRQNKYLVQPEKNYFNINLVLVKINQKGVNDYNKGR